MIFFKEFYEQSQKMVVKYCKSDIGYSIIFCHLGDSLLMVAVLGLIVLFIYAMASFAFLHNFFLETSDAELYCETLAQCMYSILRYGLLDNIGLVRNILKESIGLYKWFILC